MTRSGDGQPDPYRLLGVARQATPAEITQAWRLRARAEHPDARPRDAGAPARFRALADAYEMLSDPGRRAAFDRAARVPEPGSRAPRPAAGTTIRVIVLSPSGPPAPPVLWAGPVEVEPPVALPARGVAGDPGAWLLLLAEAAARYLDGAREWSS
jgi:curved DNA-binding protein CbpA